MAAPLALGTCTQCVFYPYCRLSGVEVFGGTNIRPQYQLALHQIDSMRKEGKFVGVDGTIPEGQGIVMAHLNECHELLEMVRFPSYCLSSRLLILTARTAQGVYGGPRG